MTCTDMAFPNSLFCISELNHILPTLVTLLLSFYNSSLHLFPLFSSLRKASCFHVIDAFFIGGESLLSRDVKSRHDLVRRCLVRAVNKQTRSEQTPLRAKELIGLERMPEVVEAMKLRMLKSGGMRPRLTVEVEDPYET